MPMDSQIHESLGLHLPSPGMVNGRSNRDILESLNHPGDAIYHPCPEAYANLDQTTLHTGINTAIPVPGAVTKIAAWQTCEQYPNTQRDIWLYEPSDQQIAHAQTRKNQTGHSIGDGETFYNLMIVKEPLNKYRVLRGSGLWAEKAWLAGNV